MKKRDSIRTLQIVLTAAVAVLMVIALARMTGAAGLPVKGDASRGYKVYLAYCFVCHGANGKGDGPYSKKLRHATPKDLADKAHFSKLSDQDIFNVISKGGAAYEKSIHMKPQGFRLTTKNIADLVAYIRFLGGEGTMERSEIAGLSNKELFNFYCASCHGTMGKGDGLLSKYFPIPPANLSKTDLIAKKTDAELYGSIAHGKSSSLTPEQSFMPAWEKTLSRDQINGLVVYIRNSLAK